MAHLLSLALEVIESHVRIIHLQLNLARGVPQVKGKGLVPVGVPAAIW